MNKEIYIISPTVNCFQLQLPTSLQTNQLPIKHITTSPYNHIFTAQQLVVCLQPQQVWHTSNTTCCLLLFDTAKTLTLKPTTSDGYQTMATNQPNRTKQLEEFCLFVLPFKPLRLCIQCLVCLLFCFVSIRFLAINFVASVLLGQKSWFSPFTSSSTLFPMPLLCVIYVAYVCVATYLHTNVQIFQHLFYVCWLTGWLTGWLVGLVRRVSTWNSILLTFSRALSCSSLQCFLVLAIIVGWLVSFPFCSLLNLCQQFFFVAIQVGLVGCCFAFSWQDEEKHVVRSLFTRNLVNGLDKSIPCRNLNTIVYMYVCMYVWRCIGISDINCICCWAEEVIRKFCFFFFGCNRNLFWKLHQTIGLFYFRSKLIWSFLVLTI